MLNHVGRIDHTEHHHNRTIIAVELPADTQAFTHGQLVTLSHAETSEPETPPDTDEGNWLDRPLQSRPSDEKPSSGP